MRASLPNGQHISVLIEIVKVQGIQSSRLPSLANTLSIYRAKHS